MTRETASAIRMARPTAAPGMRGASALTENARIMPLKAINEPSERSMPAVMMTIVSPMAKVASSAILRSRFCMLNGLKNVERAEEKKKIQARKRTSTSRTLASRAPAKRRARSPRALARAPVRGERGVCAGGSGRCKSTLFEPLDERRGVGRGDDLHAGVDDASVALHVQIIQLGLEVVKSLVDIFVFVYIVEQIDRQTPELIRFLHDRQVHQSLREGVQGLRLAVEADDLDLVADARRLHRFENGRAVVGVEADEAVDLIPEFGDGLLDVLTGAALVFVVFVGVCEEGDVVPLRPGFESIVALARS